MEQPAENTVVPRSSAHDAARAQVDIEVDADVAVVRLEDPERRWDYSEQPVPELFVVFELVVLDAADMTEPAMLEPKFVASYCHCYLGGGPCLCRHRQCVLEWVAAVAVVDAVADAVWRYML